ncbi:MAG: Panacea domain-containing protein [Melioribacteraceae bacterium]
MKALKLVYLADRFHYRKYGRFITNDKYYAMEYGPVASNTKDIASLSDYLDESEKKYASEYLSLENDKSIKSLNEIDNSILSDSDKDALEYIWNKFGNKSNFDLVNITHKYPEWLRHKEKIDSKLHSRIEMNEEDFLDDPEEDIDKCFELSEERKTALKEVVKTQNYLESLWD